jgi:hypothetical protein
LFQVGDQAGAISARPTRKVIDEPDDCFAIRMAQIAHPAEIFGVSFDQRGIKLVTAD